MPLHATELMFQTARELQVVALGKPQRPVGEFKFYDAVENEKNFFASVVSGAAHHRVWRDLHNEGLEPCGASATAQSRKLIGDALLLRFAHLAINGADQMNCPLVNALAK